jgi:hypothetical protein
MRRAAGAGDHEGMMVIDAALNRGPLLAAIGCVVLVIGWMLYQVSARCPECGNVPALCRCEHHQEHRAG